MCRFWYFLGPNVLGSYQGFRLQKPRLPAMTFGLHSSIERYWQSHITLPVPIDTTAHHGSIPKARPAGISKQSAAEKAATASTDCMMVFTRIGAMLRYFVPQGLRWPMLRNVNTSIATLTNGRGRGRGWMAHNRSSYYSSFRIRGFGVCCPRLHK
jgi:hypothetical protein